MKKKSKILFFEIDVSSIPRIPKFQWYQKYSKTVERMTICVQKSHSTSFGKIKGVQYLWLLLTLMFKEKFMRVGAVLVNGIRRWMIYVRRATMVFSSFVIGLIILVIPVAKALERKNERLLNILIDEKCVSHR